MNRKIRIRKRKSEGSFHKRPGLPRQMSGCGLRRLAAVCLIGLLVLSPCISRMQGSGQAQAAELTIDVLVKQSMLTDVTFDFFQEQVGSGIYYWMKKDGTPLFCVQQHMPQLLGGSASERSEAFEDGTHFTRSQYELVSIVLQCCRQKQEENGELAAGEYLAGQAAIWGILSKYWTGTDKLQTEMEILYEHVRDWNGMPSKELVEQSRIMEEVICQAMDDYYQDTSRYVPAFASKYPDKAPVWQAQWQEDGSCQAAFRLEDRAEAVKDFEFQLPEGWNYAWEEDQITFTCRQPESGSISVTGTAPEDSILGEAMPIGLIRLVIPERPIFQHMASGVEITTPWSCYFKLFVPEPPEGTGSWYLPQVSYYRHQEDFSAIYGVQLEKTDGDTKEPLAGVKFQALEYFDDSQLEGTVLDRTQFQTWDGWKAMCPEMVTNEAGRVSHWDRKEYHYEKSYCGGHPDPVVEYEGYSEKKRQQMEEEAWEAWEASVEDCSQRCDYHTVDGTGSQMAEADRDLAYEQFIHLTYGYTFKETEGLEGYLPHGESLKDTRIETVFGTSVQAGGEIIHGASLPQQSGRSISRVRASASSSDAPRKTASARNTAGKAASSSDAAGKTASSSNTARKIRKWTRQTNIVWLTSFVEPIRVEDVDLEGSTLYLFEVKNHKRETPPEDPTPEETPPDPPSPDEPEGGGGKDRNPPPETLPETSPPEVVLEEPVSRVGWIQARYAAAPVIDGGKIVKSSDAGSKGGRNRPGSTGDGSLPKTGECGPGAGMLLVMMLFAGGAAAGLIWKHSHLFLLGILSLTLTAAGNLEVRAEVQAEVRAEETEETKVQEGGREEEAIVPEEETKVQQEILRIIPMKPQDLEAMPNHPEEESNTPEEVYVDENGRKYELDYYRQTEHILPELEEAVSTTRFYTNLEEISQIPQQISFEAEEEETGRTGTGQLRQTDVQMTARYWSDDFFVPLTFYDYGADQYLFQDFTVPGGTELQYFLEHPDRLLEQIGCSQEKYEILKIHWDGDSYMEQGIPCRNALAAGRKLVGDYQVEYSGMVRYPETAVPEWEALYRLIPELEEETKAQEDTNNDPEFQELETESAAPPDQSVPEPEEEKNRWRMIRTLAACTISLAVLIPLILYLAAWFRKKRKDAEEKERM
ncbi:MAG: hypothetical protein Q4C66_00885 [Lachnospiraceae bacterium]|nr:hypothetical protein [Lachnospiraceae bacterium]